MDGHYTIGELARKLGLSPRTLDYYTRQGLLHPEQAGGGHGYRRYTEEDVRRVSWIKRLQAHKFSLDEIRSVLNSDGKAKGRSTRGAMEQMDLDLRKLKRLVEEARSLNSAVDQPVLKAIAGQAVQRATALCSILVTLLQDLPPL